MAVNGVSTMLYLNGKNNPSYRCETTIAGPASTGPIEYWEKCNCNVFTRRPSPNSIELYKCNSCGTLYGSE